MPVEDKYLKEELSHEEAVDTYINGNISDFKEWLNSSKTTKRDVILALDYYQEYYYDAHKTTRFIDTILTYLKKP